MKKSSPLLLISIFAIADHAQAIDNGNFEIFNTPGQTSIADFPSWSELMNPESNDAKLSAVISNGSSVISGSRSAEIVAGANGGGFRQAQAGQPLVFTAEVKFASLLPAAAADSTSRYFGMQLKHGGATSTSQVNIRVAKNGDIQVFNGTAFVAVGTLIADFTTDTGTLGIWDVESPETPVVNTLKVVANYGGTPSYSITLNGTTVSGLALFQGGAPTNGLDAVSFVGSSAAKNYLVDDVVITPDGYATWAAINAGSQTADLDFDSDGVLNGVEYFFGQTGSTFTQNPGIVGSSITWPRDPAVTDATFIVQTSTTLAADGWMNVSEADPNLVISPTSVTYNVPSAEPKLFVRLNVIIP